MPKKLNADASPLDKVLALYQRLTLNAKKHFQGDIARDLDCSPQTVTRLVAAIERNLGKDTQLESGLEDRRRYYQIRTKAEDRGFGFSFEELRYLAICRDIAAPILTESVVDRINRSFTALALHLGEINDSGLSGPPITFRSKGYIDYAPHLGTIGTLRTAIAKQQICRVSYKNLFTIF